MPINAAVTPSTRSVYSAISRNSPTPACDTTPCPSALTTTRLIRLLHFTCKVLALLVVLNCRKSKFPKQDGHFRVPQRRVTQIRMKRRG